MKKKTKLIVMDNYKIIGGGKPPKKLNKEQLIERRKKGMVNRKWDTSIIGQELHSFVSEQISGSEIESDIQNLKIVFGQLIEVLVKNKSLTHEQMFAIITDMWTAGGKTIIEVPEN